MKREAGGLLYTWNGMMAGIYSTKVGGVKIGRVLIVAGSA